jgi:hypothetical protein
MDPQPSARQPPGADPQRLTEAVIAFSDDNREAYGDEPIRRVLPIAPSTCHAHVAACTDPAKRSSGALQDEALTGQIRRVDEAGPFSVRTGSRRML